MRRPRELIRGRKWQCRLEKRFKQGQRVTYTRLGKVGVIQRVDAGLGYYVECDGWTWSVPEEALSAKLPRRYEAGSRPRKPQTQKAKDSAVTHPRIFGDFVPEQDLDPALRGNPQPGAEGACEGDGGEVA